MAIPHGIYDLKLKTGYITIGTSHNTGEFACDCILDWWQTYGKHNYLNATSILLLCDSGGSNSARSFIFKRKLQDMVNKIGIEIRICHYPPYTSKYNPIEHLLFPHVSRACRGVILRDVDILKGLMLKTKTKTGLRAFVSINCKIYPSEERASEEDKNNILIVFDDYLPQWNYTAVPTINRISPFYSLVSIRDQIKETQETLKRTMQIIEEHFPEIY
jgi:hypothetical protein